MFTMTEKSTIGMGSLAFLAGVVATLFTAYAVISKKQRPATQVRPEYDGWEDGLGV
jgi:hypothetical protein